MEDKIFEILTYTIPSIITGGVAYYFFNSHIKNENKAKKLALLADKKKESLPIKLQAYERMLLFCERINPSKLLLRVKPIGTDTNSYLQLLNANIEQEFEHNMVQQIYISDATWTAILAAKAAILNKLKFQAQNSEDANKMRENILIEYSKQISPSDTAITFIKSEVKKII